MAVSNILKRNNVTVIGEGTQPMLFAHGYGCDQNMWRYLTPYFSEDYKLVFFDYVGMGKSDYSAYMKEKYSSLEGFAEDIIEICEALDLQDVIMVGHSVSSIIGAIASIKRPDLFSHLVMVGPSPRYINDENYYGGYSKEDIEDLLEALDNNFTGWSKQMSSVIINDSNRPELAEELDESFCKADPRISRQFAHVTFLGDNRKDLKKINIPTLVIQSSSDMIAPVEVGKYVHEQIPDSVFQLLTAIGHCPHLSAPEETAAAINLFLQKETA